MQFLVKMRASHTLPNKNTESFRYEYLDNDAVSLLDQLTICCTCKCPTFSPVVDPK